MKFFKLNAIRLMLIGMFLFLATINVGALVKAPERVDIDVGYTTSIDNITDAQIVQMDAYLINEMEVEISPGDAIIYASSILTDIEKKEALLGSDYDYILNESIVDKRLLIEIQITQTWFHKERQNQLRIDRVRFV